METLVCELGEAKDLIATLTLTLSGATDEEIRTAGEYLERILIAIKSYNSLNRFKEKEHISELIKKYM